MSSSRAIGASLARTRRHRWQAAGAGESLHHSRRATRDEMGFSGFWITAVSMAVPVDMTVESFQAIVNRTTAKAQHRSGSRLVSASKRERLREQLVFDHLQRHPRSNDNAFL